MSAQNDIETSLAAYNAENEKFTKEKPKWRP